MPGPDAGRERQVIYTAHISVSDWRAFQRLSDSDLLPAARLAGAIQYRVHRNAHNAGEALLFVALPDQIAARAFQDAAGDCLARLNLPGLRDWTWESTRLDAIDERCV